MSRDTLLSGLAEVAPGWTGDVSIVVSGSTATIVPRARTSALEVFRDLVRAAQRICGGAWQWWSDATGRLVVRSSATFDLAATGTTADRLGFTGTYTGDVEYSGDDPHAGGVYPTIGLNLFGADGIAVRGQVSADGARVMSLSRQDQTGRLVCWGAFDELCGLVDTLEAGTFDVSLAGTVAARVRVTGVARAARGLLPDKTQLEVTVAAVRL